MKLALIPILLIISVIGGCDAVTGDDVSEAVIDLNTVTSTENELSIHPKRKPEPLIEPVKDSVNTFSVYSPKIIIGNVPAGGHIDGVCIKLENRYLEPLTVSVYPDRYGGESYSANNSKYYQPAPDGFEEFISIYHWGEYIIPPWSILTLPIEIDIPKDITGFPDKWEFHIKASMGAGSVLFTRVQRWLIEMR